VPPIAGVRISDVGEELARARLGDPRLTKRAQVMARAIAARPGESLPTAMRSEAAREGAYRFLSNRRVTLARVLMPHIGATVDRARTAGRVLLISDTTEFRFSTEREGLGVLTGRSQGRLLRPFHLGGERRRTEDAPWRSCARNAGTP
jgi:Transposase DNA-binding